MMYTECKNGIIVAVLIGVLLHGTTPMEIGIQAGHEEEQELTDLEEAQEEQIRQLTSDVTFIKENLTAIWTKLRERHEEHGVHIHMHDGHARHEHGDEHHEHDSHHQHDHHRDGDYNIHMYMNVDGRSGHSDRHHHDTEILYAECEMKKAPELGDEHGNIHGHIHMQQRVHGPVEVSAQLSGFDVASDVRNRAFHIHKYGDLSDGCSSLGPSLDFEDHSHHDQIENRRKAGDFGNVTFDNSGNAHMHATNNRISLYGKHSVVGRSFVVHALPYTTGLKGSAGIHVACCVIGRSKAHTHEDTSHAGVILHADCEMKKAPELGDEHGNIHGHVHMEQRMNGGPVEVSAQLSGFDVTSDVRNRAFHIHKYGDISDGCKSLGPPVDFEDGQAGNRKAGDFGNITFDDSGNARMQATNNRIALYGRNSVVGRSFVVHSLPYTTGKKGSAGIHVACCIIGRTKAHAQEDSHQDNGDGNNANTDSNHFTGEENA